MFGGGSSVLSDIERFPKLYRMLPPDVKMNRGRIGLMKAFGWSKISTIHQASAAFSKVHYDDFNM